MNRYQKVGKGIRLVFIGQICGVLSLYEIMVAISLLFFMAGLYLGRRGPRKSCGSRSGWRRARFCWRSCIHGFSISHPWS